MPRAIAACVKDEGRTIDAEPADRSEPDPVSDRVAVLQKAPEDAKGGASRKTPKEKSRASACE